MNLLLTILCVNIPLVLGKTLQKLTYILELLVFLLKLLNLALQLY